MTDLTDAVEAAARDLFHRSNPAREWTHAADIVRFRYREAVLPIVAAAAPAIEAAVRAHTDAQRGAP